MKTIDKVNPFPSKLENDNREMWSGHDPAYLCLRGHEIMIQNGIRRDKRHGTGL